MLREIGILPEIHNDKIVQRLKCIEHDLSQLGICDAFNILNGYCNS